MLLFPNCKINIGLHITSKRNDGYHNLETVFYPVNWCDVLEITTATAVEAGSVRVRQHLSGLPVPGNAADNICTKAFELLSRDFPSIPPVELWLHKAIPTGAGLGGGSADGAHTLLLLNQKYALGLSIDQLIAYASRLGSDCPFFILNRACYATGRGELLEPLSLDLSGYAIVLINPGIHVNTGWAFSNITPLQPAVSLKELVQQPVETWKDNLKNDFEKAVFEQYPAIKRIKLALYNYGAVYAAMTGSGSTVYGIFKRDAVPEMEWAPITFKK